MALQPSLAFQRLASAKGPGVHTLEVSWLGQMSKFSGIGCFSAVPRLCLPLLCKNGKVSLYIDPQFATIFYKEG